MGSASQTRQTTRSPGLAFPLFASSVLIALVAWLPWARRWTYSGAALESLLLVYGSGIGSRILPALPLWSLLAAFNCTYAVCSTSWLLYALFSITCYPLMFITSLWQFAPVANLARRTLRRTLRQFHFTKDKIGLFNLPALEIDTDTSGLLVVRGLTISLSSLTIVAHGIELGLRLTDDIELAISVDEVTISLFRQINIGETFLNLKDDAQKMMFAKRVAADGGIDSHGVLVSETQILKAAEAGSADFSKKSHLREQMTGVSYMEDVAPSAFLDPVEVVDLDDDQAEQRYLEVLAKLRDTSAVGQGRLRTRFDAQSEDAPDVLSGGEARMAVVVSLQDLPSVPHPPAQSVRVTTLQTLAPPMVRRFLHRLPFLLRLLLQPLSYLHPITAEYVTASGPGRWVLTLLSENVFKQYSEVSAEVKRLEAKISKWLTDADFSVQLGGFAAITQVPVSTSSEIGVEMKASTDEKVYCLASPRPQGRYAELLDFRL